MEKKKNSRIAEFIITGIVIICLSLIVLQLSDNISNKVEEIKAHSENTN